jgi:hypothetical protein
LEKHKLPGSDQIMAEMIRAGGEKLRSETQKLTDSVLINEVEVVYYCANLQLG